MRGLTPFARLQLRAYTIWNLAFLGVRVALNQAQWDSFLAVNSLGIACGFRTAMCQGIGENMRRKLAAQLAHDGLDLLQWQVQQSAPHCASAPQHASAPLYAYASAPVQFFIADHAIHTLPPLVLITALVRRAERVHPMVRNAAAQCGQPAPPTTRAPAEVSAVLAQNCVYVLACSTWFAFRQGAQLDSSEIYVPHPWRRAWLAIVTSVLCTPSLVDALISRKRGKAALVALVALVPYLLARLDPGLRQKYKFEFELTRLNRPVATEAAPAKQLPRCSSSPPPGLATLQ